MAYMEWSSAFNIGVPVFDDEHKKLVAMINAVADCIAAGTHATALRKVENDLIEYTIVHFRHEEMYFDDFDYPDAQQHKARHAEMKARVFAMRDEVYNNPTPELAAEILQFLRDWLSEHIVGEDKPFGAFLKERGYGTSAGRLPF
ncbi:MAG TPA: bacteriohemerythrin [Rhizomicrobium sp.]|nr:bacteriohemerythrin [Rhizomicrobium sp.]